MAPGDLSKTQAALTVLLDGEIVQAQRSSADVLAFQAGAPHAGAHPLDDQAAFEFGGGADDHDESTAQRAAGVDLLAETDRQRDLLVRSTGVPVEGSANDQRHKPGPACSDYF